MVKNPPANAGDARDVGTVPGFSKIPWRRTWEPTPVFLPGKFHGQRSLSGHSPWGSKESEAPEYTHTHTHTHTLYYDSPQCIYNYLISVVFFINLWVP